MLGASGCSVPCDPIPAANLSKEAWGVHGGLSITGATGSYARGHGTISLAARTTTGISCR
jgi:hypothetical protein